MTHFKVDEQWLIVCGLPHAQNIFSVISIDANNDGPSYVTVDRMGFPWVVDCRRGEFVDQGRV